MKVTILNGSPRKNGNTEIMVNEFAKGAKEAGHETTVINLAGKKVNGCLGCQYCFAHDGVCVQKDDMAEILKVLDETDLVVFASPIYWFDITGQLKCVIDRMYARGKIGFHFNKTALLLDSASDHVYDAALSQYKATCSYLRWESVGEICIPDMEEKGSMRTVPALQKVYELGKSL
ncbi:MAG: flavodoxin family protein [Lachnospiraceae bacterium]|nr:flavodoxin family protein [Lachnospiraceae bacterium]